jgi:putative endonuclease
MPAFQRLTATWRIAHAGAVNTKTLERARRGRAAEALAARFLAARGLQVLALNFRCRGGELDLVCREGKHLVIVEVRQRSQAAFGGALASIDAGKQRRLRRATAYFLLLHPRWHGHRVRFDAFAIDGLPDRDPKISWVRAAF